MKKSNILAIGATVLLLAGCGNGKSSDVSKKAGGKYAAKQELNWTESNTLATADLSKATDTLSFNVLMNTQEGLYRLDKNGTPQLALAKKPTFQRTARLIILSFAKASSGQTAKMLLQKILFIHGEGPLILRRLHRMPFI